MSTLFLAILIFGTAGYVIYARIKKGKSCGDCPSSCCEVKKK